MVKTAKNIFAIYLAVTLLASGLPLTMPGDANRDNRIDLADAILTMRTLVTSGDHHEEFMSAVRMTITTLQAAAGIKTVIQAPHNRSSSVNLANIDSHFLTSSPIGLNYTIMAFWVAQEAIHFTSHIVSPAPPPPEME
jgi:hypothetical protein